MSGVAGWRQRQGRISTLHQCRALVGRSGGHDVAVPIVSQRCLLWRNPELVRVLLQNPAWLVFGCAWHLVLLSSGSAAS